MAGEELTTREVLEMVPQQEPFRFIDEILELDDEHIVATYTFREDADFYRVISSATDHAGRDPDRDGGSGRRRGLRDRAGRPRVGPGRGREAAHDLHRLSGRLLRTVKPGQRVTTTGRKKFWRRKKLRAEFEMKLDDGTVVCSGEVSGMGVPR